MCPSVLCLNPRKIQNITFLSYKREGELQKSSNKPRSFNFWLINATSKDNQNSKEEANTLRNYTTIPEKFTNKVGNSRKLIITSNKHSLMCPFVLPAPSGAWPYSPRVPAAPPSILPMWHPIHSTPAAAAIGACRHDGNWVFTDWIGSGGELHADSCTMCCMQIMFLLNGMCITK